MFQNKIMGPEPLIFFFTHKVIVLWVRLMEWTGLLDFLSFTLLVSEHDAYSEKVGLHLET